MLVAKVGHIDWNLHALSFGKSANQFFVTEAMNVVAKQAAFLLENAEHIAPEERIAELKKLSDCLTESLKDAEEKCAMAQATYKTVTGLSFFGVYLSFVYV